MSERAAAPPASSTDWRHTTTERLFLDLPADTDVDDLFAIHSDPDSWRHFPLGRHTHRREAVNMVEQAEQQFARDGLGFWSVRDQPGGRVVGRGGCTIPTGRMWWNLYYRFAGSVHRRGYATEMATRAIEAARDVEPARPVVAYLLEHNEASRRTAERLGMVLAWRGPDRPNPDPDAVRLVYVDRDPTDELVAAIEAHALG
jgi:RimJ/RimL family protein N-acetyltransferase